MKIAASKKAPGRPFRFLLLVVMLWVGSRTATLIGWHPGPAATMAGLPAEADTNVAGGFNVSQPAKPATMPAKPSQRGALAHISEKPEHAPYTKLAQTVRLADPATQGSAKVAVTVASRADATDRAYIPSALPTRGQSHDRWAASAWLFWRAGSGNAQLSSTGQLGGSQAGMRLDHDLSPESASRLAAYGRFSSALMQPRGAEGALGLAFQPTRTVPITVAVERRIALDDSGRNAMAVLAYGGIGPTPIAQALEIEGYGQTGIVGMRSRDAFADGKVTISHPFGPHDFALGLSVSGGVQPRLSRLDVGPQIETRVRLGNGNARLVAEWRYRILGSARPNSGLAVTFAADF